MWSRIFCLSWADESNAFQRLDGAKLPWTQTFIPVWTAPLYSQWTLERREASLCLSQQDLIYLYISLFVFGWLIYQWVSYALISFQTFPFYFWLWAGNCAILFCASSLLFLFCFFQMLLIFRLKKNQNHLFDPCPNPVPVLLVVFLWLWLQRRLRVQWRHDHWNYRPAPNETLCVSAALDPAKPPSQQRLPVVSGSFLEQSAAARCRYLLFLPARPSLFAGSLTSRQQGKEKRGFLGRN